ncbi:MAG: tRNA-dihydrouridine synthase [Planctomycetota bacterium]|nr:tRNA-dihydrouridine synthase [Planctomycetota bacterium]
MPITWPKDESTTEELDGSAIEFGGRRIPSRYFLAPLAGYTHHAFRLAIRELGGLGLATTDLVLATRLLSQHPKSLELIETCSADCPLSIQIFSGKKDQLVLAAQWLEDHGYQGVDINMGCPMAKVNSQGGGARLMCDSTEAAELAACVVAAVDIPVTVKMRLGWDAESISAPLLARQFEDVGVAAVTVHGRTRQQGFHGQVDLEGIRRTVEAVSSIPIIGNGDVRTPDDAFRMRRETGCHAVAIGRGAMLDPWIYRKIQQRLAGQTPIEPERDEKIRFLCRHFALMTQQHADYSCVLFRKFAGWYGAKLGIPEDLEDRLRRFESVSEFDAIVGEITERYGTRTTSIPTALIRVPNGPVERW